MDVPSHDQLTLAGLVVMQRSFDETHFTGATCPEDKRRHIAFHVGILAAKLLRFEERVDHGDVEPALVGMIEKEVVPDLLVYASQLAALMDIDLEDAYVERLRALASRPEQSNAGAGT